MKIKAKIDRMVNSGNVKAIASVSLDGMFVVKNLKVMDGKKGLFVSMPQETYSGKDGQKKYSNLFFALTNSAKLELQETVLQAYQQQIGALSEAIPTLYRLALDTYQSGGDALVEQIDQLNGQEQNAQQKYERELADYYTQLEQKGNAYNTAYTQDYGRYQDYLGQLDSLYGYYAAQEQQEAARRQQGFNNVMTVLGLLGDAAQLAITGTTGLGSMAGSLLNTGYNIYAGNRAYEAERADTAWKQKMQEQLRQDELAQQQYKNEQAQQEYQDKLRQQQVSNALAAERLDLSKSQWAAKQEKASRTAEKASADAAAKRGSLTGDTGLKVGKSGVSSGGTVPYSAARMRSQGRSDTAIRTQLLKEGYSSSEVREIMRQLNS
jgi:DNA-binding cell septation regulator SpoVG